MTKRKQNGRHELTMWKPLLKSLYGDGCYICRSGPYEVLTVDHLVPKYEGGQEDLLNLRLCCKKCNTFKSFIETYMAGLQYRKVELMPTDKQIGRIRSAWQYFAAIVRLKLGTNPSSVNGQRSPDAV